MVNFANVRDLSVRYPFMFDPPPLDVSLKEHDRVQICVIADPYPPEKFWVEIVKINDDSIIGKVRSKLLFKEHGIKEEDTIEFSKENIFDLRQI